MSSYRNVLGCASVLMVIALPAHASIFTLTPVTNTTPNFGGTILIQGTVTIGAGETFIPGNVMSTQSLPFLSNFSAGFNGNGQTFDPAFLAWNGLGSYTGAIYDHQISANNLGYSSGMPVGLYGSNILGPGGLSSIVLYYAGIDGTTKSMTAAYAINVVPTPGAMGVLGLGGLLAAKRRR